ncbi:MAG: alpha/beta fold hydrolase [Bacteriovoracia bacterium]
MFFERSKAITLDNAEIAYFDNELVHRPTIVFIHGNSGSHRTFEKQACSPLNELYRLVFFDLPGHGDSSLLKGEMSFSLPSYASVVIELLEKLQIKKPLVVGHSLGGHIALEVVGRGFEVAGVCIVGTPPVANPPNLSEAFLPNPYSNLFFGGAISRSQAEILVSQNFGQSFNSNIDRFVEDFQNTEPTARIQLYESVAALKFSDEIEIVKNLEFPICVVFGNEEKLMSIEYAKKIEIPTLWRKKIQIVSAAGHMPQFEEPEFFNKILNQYASDIWKVDQPLMRERPDLGLDPETTTLL